MALQPDAFPYTEQVQLVEATRGLYADAIAAAAPRGGWLSGHPFGLVRVMFNRVSEHADEHGASVQTTEELDMLPVEDPSRFEVPMKDWPLERFARRVVPGWFGEAPYRDGIHFRARIPDEGISTFYTRRVGNEADSIDSLSQSVEQPRDMFTNALDFVGVIREYLANGNCNEIDGVLQQTWVEDSVLRHSRIKHSMTLALSPEVAVNPSMPGDYLKDLARALEADRVSLADQFDQILGERGNIDTEERVSEGMNALLIGATLGQTDSWLRLLANERTLVKDALTNVTNILLDLPPED